MPSSDASLSPQRDLPAGKPFGGDSLVVTFTDKTVDYNTERKVLSVRENRTKCIIIIGFLYTYTS